MKLPELMYEWAFYVAGEDLKSYFSGHFTCVEGHHYGRSQALPTQKSMQAF